MQVRLRCGLSNELNDVDEPSRCEYVDATDSSIFPKKICSMPSSYVPICHCRYVAVLSTPAVCVEEKLKVLSLSFTNVIIFPFLKRFEAYTIVLI